MFVWWRAGRGRGGRGGGERTVYNCRGGRNGGHALKANEQLVVLVREREIQMLDSYPPFLLSEISTSLSLSLSLCVCVCVCAGAVCWCTGPLSTASRQTS